MGDPYYVRATKGGRVKGRRGLLLMDSSGKFPHMTVVADDKHRVTLRHAKPGERFDVAIVEPGKYVLTKLEPAQPRPARVRIEKRNGYTVGILNEPIDMAALKEALADFPP